MWRREAADVAHETFCRGRSAAVEQLPSRIPWPLPNGYAASLQNMEGTKSTKEGAVGEHKFLFPTRELVVFRELAGVNPLRVSLRNLIE